MIRTRIARKVAADIAKCEVGRGMFEWFRSRPKHDEKHPRSRELRALMSCLVAWRRAVVEARYRDRAADQKTLEAKRSALGWYAHAAGGTDPFTAHVLAVPVGELDEPLFLGSLFRIEAAVAIAWTLGLVETVPKIEERASFVALDALFPVDGSPAASILGARLRDRAELERELDEWKAKTASARKMRDESGDESTSIQFSRAYERARAIAWVCSENESIDDTVMDV